MGNIIEIILISFLCFRFTNPENLLLQKFDIVVSFWCWFVLFASLLTFLCFVWDEQTKKRVREQMKKNNFIGVSLSLIVTILLVLNDFNLGFIFYAIYLLISILIRSCKKEEK